MTVQWAYVGATMDLQVLHAIKVSTMRSIIYKHVNFFMPVGVLPRCRSALPYFDPRQDMQWTWQVRQYEINCQQ